MNIEELRESGVLGEYDPPHFVNKNPTKEQKDAADRLARWYEAMTKSKKAIYWRSDPAWYRTNEAGDFEMTEEAPEDAVKNFEEWKKAWGIEDENAD